jgi:hypothetical protein
MNQLTVPSRTQVSYLDEAAALLELLRGVVTAWRRAIQSGAGTTAHAHFVQQLIGDTNRA